MMVRTLFESIAIPEVNDALRDWCSTQKACALIGGCALGFYVRPRSTFDVDVLFLTDAAVPAQVPGFKRNRNHGFQHNRTHVEIDMVTPEWVEINPLLAKQVIDTAVESDGCKVASPSGLVAMKLERFSRQDQADIEQLIIHCDVDLTGFQISSQAQNHWQTVQSWDANQENKDD